MRKNMEQVNVKRVGEKKKQLKVISMLISV